MRKFVAASSLLLAALSTPAHDTWLIPSVFRTAPGTPVVLRFATSEAFPTSDAALGLDRVAQFTMRTAAGAQPVTGYKQEGKFLVATVTPGAAGHTVVVAETKPRFLEMKPADFNDYIGHEELKHVMDARAKAGKSEAPGRELYRKIAKTVLCVGDVSGDSTYAEQGGLWLDVIPERSPCGLQVGDALTVRVLFQGQPLAGARVAAGYEGVTGHSYPVWIATDKNGRATVRFTRAGAWFIRTLHMVTATGSAEADWQSAFSTLTLEVGAGGGGGARLSAVSRQPDKGEGAQAAIRRVLEEQDAAWNRGDIEAFVGYYWKAGGLTFSGANGVTRGWQGLLDRYRHSYPTRAAMGRLSFSDLDIRMLAPNAALVLGRWRLDREKDTPGGVFTLVLRKLPEGWRIVHDHTSSDQ